MNKMWKSINFQIVQENQLDILPIHWHLLARVKTSSSDSEQITLMQMLN